MRLPSLLRPFKSRTRDQNPLALGGRSLADLIAPAAVEVGRDYLRLDAQYLRVLAVTGYPRTVGPDWLSPLIDFEAPVPLVLHISPRDSTDMVHNLHRKLVQLQSSRLLDQRSGRLADPEREVAFEDAERLRDALQRGDEKIFAVSFYLLVQASSLAELDDLTRRVQTTIGGLLAQSRVAVLEQDS